MLNDLDINLDFFDNKSGRQLKSRYVKPKKYKAVAAYRVKYEHAKEMAQEVSEQIMSGGKVYALLSGNFIFGDFIEAFAVENDLLIDDLTVSTLGYSKENVDSFLNLIKGDYVQSLNLIVSDYFFSHNRDNVKYTYEQLDIDDKFQLAIAGVHTKVTLIRAGDRKIVMTGSANLRSSRSVEEITIQTDDELYDFHKEWHNEILKHYSTINKSIRASNLWEIIK